VEEMSIGEFARRSRLSPKALRLYDGLGVLPPARVDELSGYRYYEGAQLEQARLIASIADERLPLVSDIMARIGAPYGWRSTNRSPQEWPAWFAEHPGRTCWLLALNDEPVGVACYDPHPDAEVEIKTFGLVPEFTGKGLGGYALTLAIRRAWELVPGTRRVWLHTSSADNPSAPQLPPPRISHLQDR
jgi:RimJ/RimL family protein N-acetyltransferase